MQIGKVRVPDGNDTMLLVNFSYKFYININVLWMS